MCWACEQEQLAAAYREYVAERRAQRPATADGVAAAPAQPDWAKGTWFAAAIDPEE
jgi:hypothetical protein